MGKYSDIIFATIVVVLIVASIAFMNGSQDTKIANQAILIEQLQGDVKAMTSAFKEMSLELLKSQYAYSTWSIEIDGLRDSASQVPEIPEIGRWRNRKGVTR